MSSACKTYVRWYNEYSRGNWATWEPGDKVVPGNIGTFDKQLRFWATEVLSKEKVEVKSARKAGPVSHSWGADIGFTSAAGGKSFPSLDGIAGLDGDFRLEASREGACYLHLDEMSESWVVNEADILAWVAAHLTGWELNTIIVMKRLRASRGFAFIAKRRGASLEVSASAAAAPLASAAISVKAGRGGGGFQLYEFGKGSTPVFSRTFRVHHGLWDRLVPWEREGPVLIRPDGKRYRGPLSPSDLAGAPAQARRYDPRRSAITPEVLASIAVEDLFEEVTSVADLGELEPGPAGSGPGARLADRLSTYRALPVPPRPAPLAAADPAAAALPVVPATSADGTVRLALFLRDDDDWLLEVTLTSPELAPLIVPVRYDTVGGGQRELLVPVEAWGGRRMGSSIARLRDYAGYEADWAAGDSVSPDAIGDWPPEVLASSVRSAVGSATIEAWKHLAASGPPDARPVIAEALRSFEARP